MNTRLNRSLVRKPLWLVLLLAAFLGISAGAWGQTRDLCIPSIGGLVDAPTMDGRPEGDVGWNNAVQVGLRESMGAPRIGTLQLGRKEVSATDKSVYLSIDLTGFNQPSAGGRGPGLNDTVVLALSTDADPTHDWRIHVSPFTSPIGDPLLSQNPRTKKFWRGSATWNLPNPNAPTACSATDVGKYSTCPKDLTIGDIKVARTGSRWSLEVKLPYHSDAMQAGADNAIYIPASGTFRLYSNVVSTNDLSGTYVEDPWPTDAELTRRGNEFIQNSTPDKGTVGVAGSWGVVSLNDRPAVCTGVKILTAGVRATSNAGAALGSASLPVPPSGTNTTGIYYNVGTTQAQDAAQCMPLLNNHLWAGTQQNPTGTRGLSNWFVARAENTSTTNAAAIAAQFQIAPWGLPSAVGTDWDLIGKRFDPDSATCSDPIVGCNDIFSSPSPALAGSSTEERQTNWQLSYKESCMYVLSNRTTVGGKPAGHHCIQAELTSTDPATVFLRKSLQFNHDVVVASTVSRVAAISARGYGPPPNGRLKHDILLQLDSVVRSYRRDGDYYYASSKPLAASAMGRGGNAEVDPQFREFFSIHASNFPNGLTEAMTWIARGYLKTGKGLGIENQRYEKTKYIGGFSMEAGHAGPVDGWVASFAGPDRDSVESMGSDYVAHIDQDEVLQLTTTVEAREKGSGRYAVWVALGRTFPNGSFSNAYDDGLTGTVGLEYSFTPTLSLEGTLSGNRFAGQGGASDIDVMQLGVNAKWYFTPQPLRWFATAGVGAYRFNPGSTRFGGNVGVGLQYWLTQQLSLEARYGFNAVASNAPNSNFSTLQLGVRFAF